MMRITHKLIQLNCSILANTVHRSIGSNVSNDSDINVLNFCTLVEDFVMMDVSPIPSSSYSMNLPLSSNSALQTETSCSTVNKTFQEGCESDDFLLEAMICSVCYSIYDEPKQLQCGHSFCATCIDRLRNDVEWKYTCPLCRARFTNPPVINYSLKSLISRIKERGAMVKYCHQCSKIAKLEDQYCCDDCDHIDRIERVRCGLCVINGHAKMGHSVSKHGESTERVKAAQQALNEMVNEAMRFLIECKKMANDRLICMNNVFKLLEGQRKQFKMLETTINTDKFVSKKDIEMRLGHARRLHEIYMRCAFEFVGYLNTMFNDIMALTERTDAELASHAVDGDILNKKQLISRSAEEQTRSWFEYQRTGRLSALCSAIARRNAAIARRRLVTCNPQSEAIFDSSLSSLTTISVESTP